MDKLGVYLMRLESGSMMASGVERAICWAVGNRVGRPMQLSGIAQVFRGVLIGNHSHQLLALRCARFNSTFAQVAATDRRHQPGL